MKHPLSYFPLCEIYPRPSHFSQEKKETGKKILQRTARKKVVNNVLEVIACCGIFYGDVFEVIFFVVGFIYSLLLENLLIRCNKSNCFLHNILDVFVY